MRSIRENQGWIFFRHHFGLVSALAANILSRAPDPRSSNIGVGIIVGSHPKKPDGDRPDHPAASAAGPELSWLSHLGADRHLHSIVFRAPYFGWYVSVISSLPDNSSSTPTPIPTKPLASAMSCSSVMAYYGYTSPPVRATNSSRVPSSEIEIPTRPRRESSAQLLTPRLVAHYLAKFRDTDEPGL
ncbi:unnamed protein product [Mycena citricolor]|uniref:Uncharacterized protein n=1 Tax=Mycena citricolor TaxID=2018698 RepID=A0AAD2K788_9AGAR|nr:unnamed protein product [Mycena citricolor]